MTDYIPSQLKSHISTLKSNQHLYNSKLSEITSTRQIISEQLDQLQSTYDKKIKLLENKLVSFQEENQQLVKQNLLFQNQICNFQNRLLEKEKIIALLLQQKKEGGFSGSDRSKSQQNQSAKASEDGFRKERNSPQSKPQGGISNVWNKKKQAISQHKENQPEIVQNTEKVIEVHKIPAPPPKKKKVLSPSPPHQKEEPKKDVQTPVQVFKNMRAQQQEPEVIPQQQKAVTPPPPPRPKNKPKKPPTQAKKAPISKYEDQVQDNTQQNSQLLSYFSNEQAPQLQQNTRKISQIKEPQETNQREQDNTNLPSVINPQQEYYNDDNLNYPQQNNYKQQENHYGREINNKQFATEKKSRYETQNEGNNFLDHFNQNNLAQNEQESTNNYSNSIKKKKKASKRSPIQQAQDYETQKAFQPQQQFNSNDFFNQMGKNEPEPSHHLQIEESSIDHIDRDSSMLSNEQPYFNEDPVQTNYSRKQVKMTKKKGRRDKVKQADPSLFV